MCPTYNNKNIFSSFILPRPYSDEKFGEDSLITVGVMLTRKPKKVKIFWTGIFENSEFLLYVQHDPWYICIQKLSLRLGLDMLRMWRLIFFPKVFKLKKMFITFEVIINTNKRKTNMPKNIVSLRM